MFENLYILRRWGRALKFSQYHFVAFKLIEESLSFNRHWFSKNILLFLVAPKQLQYNEHNFDASLHFHTIKT